MGMQKVHLFKFVLSWPGKRRQFGGRASEWVLECSALDSDSLHLSMAQLSMLYKLAVSISHRPTPQGKQVQESQLITFLESRK